MRVRYTPEAFVIAKEYSSTWGNVRQAIREAVTLLSDQPYSGYRTNDPDVLVKFVARYPYKIFYRVRGDAIEIAHIRHTSRRPWVEER